MRKIILALTALTIFSLPLAAEAQTGEPEYVGSISAHDPTIMDKYLALERVTVSTEALGGLFSSRSVMTAPGEHSPTRFKANEPIEFVIRVERQDRDPSSYVQFFKLESSSGKRILTNEIVSSGLFANQAKQVLNSQSVPFQATKLGTNFFKFTASKPLAPGEYLLGTYGPDTPSFAFGIDP